MATLTGNYQYIGRTNASTSSAGYDYYVLLYAKTSGSTSTGKHTVSVKMRMACTSKSTFYNYKTSGSATVDGVSAISWSEAFIPNAAWNTDSLTEDGVTYPRWVDMREGTAVIDTAYVAKNVVISTSWRRHEIDGTPPNYLPSYTAITASISVTLPIIATATVPAVSADSVALGEKVTISLPRQSSAFVHNITMSLKAAGSDTVAHSATIGTDCGDKMDWFLPYDLASKIPAATSGTVTLTVTTKLNAQIIGSKPVSFTVTVPDNETTKPKITALTLSPIHSLPSQFAGVYVKGYSKVAAAMAASSDYSTIYRYMVTINGVSDYITTSDSSRTVTTSRAISAPGDQKVKCTVFDARGYSRTIERIISVADYFDPKVIPNNGETNIVCARCDGYGNLASAGIYLRIKAGKSYAKVISDGVQKNSCTLQYRYRSSTGLWSSWITLLADGSGSDYVDTSAIGNVVGDVKTSYVVELRAYDTIGGDGNAHTLSFVIPTDQIDFHLREGGKGAAFGKYSEIEGLLDVDWDLRLSNGRHADMCLKSEAYFDNGAGSEQGLENWFDTVLSTMPNNSVKFMEVFASEIHTWRFMGYLYKADNDYAVFSGICYDGSTMLKNKWAGTWSNANKNWCVSNTAQTGWIVFSGAAADAFGEITFNLDRVPNEVRFVPTATRGCVIKQTPTCTVSGKNVIVQVGLQGLWKTDYGIVMGYLIYR